MDYHFSTPVDTSTIDQWERYASLCDGIPVRVHSNQVLEDLGCIRAQEDWRKRVDPSLSRNVKGLLGPHFNVASAMFPETYPDRLEILAYFNEYVGLHDDVVEEVDKTGGDLQNDEARDTCTIAAERGLPKRYRSNNKEERNRGRQRMIAKVAKQMLAIDPEPARAALKLWAEWFDQGSRRKFHTEFRSLEDYLEYRVLDVGQKLCTGMAIFGMGLIIPEHEMPILEDLCRPAWVAMGLTNDIVSYEKEKRAAQTAGKRFFCNAISVLMNRQSDNDHDISEVDAEELVRQEIARNVSRFVNVTLPDTRIRTDISSDLRLFVESTQYLISGNVAWSLNAPRYNPGAQYNSRQLDWMLNGTPRVFSKVGV